MQPAIFRGNYIVGWLQDNRCNLNLGAVRRQHFPNYSIARKLSDLLIESQYGRCHVG